LKLNSVKLALSAAIISAILMLLLTLDAMYMGKGLRLISLLGGVFPGYDISWQGAGLGIVYGFVTCFVYIWLVATGNNLLIDWKGFKKAKKAARKKKR